MTCQVKTGMFLNTLELLFVIARHESESYRSFNFVPYGANTLILGQFGYFHGLQPSVP